MKIASFSANGHQLLVLEPNGRQYGHLAIEQAMALAEARRLGARLWILTPESVVSEALLQFECDDVPITRPNGLWRRLGGFGLNTSWARQERRSKRRVSRIELLTNVRRRVSRRINDHRMPYWYRDGLRRVAASAERMADNLWQEQQQQPPYYRRRLLLPPLKVRPSAELEQWASEPFARAGLAGKRLVTIHVREPGYKRGREVEDKGAKNNRFDSVRNASVESHFEAIDHLVSKGYTVVRVGDPSMTPLRRPGVVDLATSPEWDDRLQFYALFRSAFLICSESGPLLAAYLTDTPILTVNSTDPISAYPIRPSGFYLLKHIVDRATGRTLRLPDLLEPSHLARVRDKNAFSYEDNTGPEIAEAVEEMCQWLAGEYGPESDAQQWYRSAATASAESVGQRLRYVRKWGTHAGFLGEGRLVRASADRGV